MKKILLLFGFCAFASVAVFMFNGGILKGAQLAESSAAANSNISLNVMVNDSDYIFMPPSQIGITVNVNNSSSKTINGSLVVAVTTDKYETVQSDTMQVGINSNATMSAFFNQYNNFKPGFYRYTVSLILGGVKAAEKKLNIGYDPEHISAPLDNKSDFNEFWNNNLKELSKVKREYKLTEQPQMSTEDYTVYLVEFFSLNREKVRGYYAKPKAAGKYPVIIEYMGYASKPYPPNTQIKGFAHFLLSVRGQALNEAWNKYGQWITYGLDSKEKYYYRGAFCDVVSAVDFVCSRPEIDTGKIAVRGGSQGGALSFAAAALDRRVKVAAPNIPFLSDYRNYFKIVPWPKSDFDVYMKRNPAAKWDNIYDVLTYFDIKNLAQRITCPLIMGLGVQDEICPPHINFAAFNQVKSEKVWIASPEMGHSMSSEYRDASIQFIKEKLGVQ